MWSVEMDDFNNVCNDGNYPLLRTINRIVGDGEHVEVSDDDSEGDGYLYDNDGDDHDNDVNNYYYGNYYY